MLPEILDRLVTDSPYQFELTVVGTGSLTDSLVTSVTKKGLDSAINFRGQVPNGELPGMYAAHDLFVYPGIWEEPFGRIFIEALAAGTPVVGTDVGAVAEIIGNAGIVTSATPEALADAIVEAVAQSDLRTYAAATEQEIKQYTADSVGDQFETLYQQASERR
jgi:glycosyltransferase involved in cell wall biosynthesis